MVWGISLLLLTGALFLGVQMAVKGSVLCEDLVSLFSRRLPRPVALFATAVLLLWAIREPGTAVRVFKLWLFNPVVLFATYFIGQCPYITDGMNAFVGANPNYTWTWAVPAFNLQSDLTVSDYYAWVVTSPNMVNGFALGDGIANQDVGGADFGLT